MRPQLQLRSIRFSSTVSTMEATMLTRQPEVLMRTGMGRTGGNGP